MKDVTLGMCTYDDLDGVYFTVQANRIMHPILESNGEIIVIDNNPKSRFGKETKRFCENTGCVRYVPFTERIGTSVRNRLFDLASSEVVICVDCHVLLLPGAIDTVHTYFSSSNKPTLLQGPMVNDSLKYESTEWMDCWRKNFHGIWGPRRKVSEQLSDHHEITNMGLGAFAAKRSEWPGFNPLFRGFGGEEGYIHRKYVKNGGVALSLPAFRWTHRFYRPSGPPYSLKYSDRIFNYFIGCFELEENPDRIIEYFSTLVGSRMVRRIYDEALQAHLNSIHDQMKIHNNG